MIGQIQVKSLDWKVRAAELAYVVDTESRRQGFGHEMLQVAIEELFERKDFNRIFLRVIPSNEASLDFAKKLGFETEGIQRSAFKAGSGEIRDVIFLSRIRGTLT